MSFNQNNDSGNNSLLQTAQANGRTQILGAYTPAASPDEPAVIRLMKAHDHQTVAHELGHHVRNLYGQLAQAGTADPLFKMRYRTLERRYGVMDGNWTRAQEEAFTNDFVRDYLVAHKIPPEGLAETFAGMRELALDLYENADAVGLPMTREAREVLDATITMRLEEGRRKFEEALADINTRLYEKPFLEEADFPGPAPQEIEAATSLERLQKLNSETSRDVDLQLAELEKRSPELAAAERKNRELDLAELDRQAQNLKAQEELLPDLVGCYYNAM